MLLLSCRKIRKSFNKLEVLRDINFDLARGEKVGLVGRNGSGKTTLVDIISGSQDADEGKIIRHQEPVKVGYLRQKLPCTEDTLKRAKGLEDKLQAGEFYQVTSTLGLEKVKEWESNRLEIGLSGGEKTKLALAEVWVSKPDLLVLDEPTNHLDFQGRDWLIDKVNNFPGAVIIISHDRYFLDRTAKKILELEDGTLTVYSGNYTDYREEKKRRYEAQLHRHREQKKKEKLLENQIAQLDRWASQANQGARKKAIETGMKFGGKEFYRAKAKKMDKQVKSRRKRLEKLRDEGVEKPTAEPEVSFSINDPAKRGRRVIEVRDISKSYGNKCLFQESTFYILHGDRIGLLGPNGCGKTTLLKMLLGEVEPDAGEIWVSSTLKTGYLSQEVSGLPQEKTPMETLPSLQGFYNSEARHMLVNLGFTEEMLNKPIKKLSMGEQTRLQIADLILNQHDCLVLDEPTNHLDLFSREELEDNLAEYQGTMLIVSHDNYMLEKLCDQLLVFEDGLVRRVERNYQEYQRRKKEQARNGLQEGIKTIKEEIICLEISLASIAHQLDTLNPDEPEYEELDKKYRQLAEKKRKLNARLE
ncbi:MAG: ABC-F type ribosomal protection protein [Halanaerobium sp.]|nr:ABC-F type ribosomal protection protein [Halanaerobium sp.]